MGDDRREIASKADDRRLVPWLAPCRFRRPSREGLPSIIPDRGELGQILRVLFSRPIPKQIAPTLVRGQRRGTCGCSIIVPGPCAGGARSDGMAGSRRTAAREKNGGRVLFLAMTDPAAHPAFLAADFAAAFTSATTGHAFSSGLSNRLRARRSHDVHGFSWRKP